MAVQGENIRRSLATNWWTLVGRGIVAILFGLAAIGWPAITSRVLLTLFAIFVLVDGAMAIAASVQAGREKRRWWPYLFEGLIGITIGILLFVIPGITARILLFFIALWAIGVGILKIGVAIELRKQIQGEWLLATSGLISVLFGTFLLAFPLEGALAFVVIIGIYAIVVGTLLILLGINLNNWQKALRQAQEEEEHKHAA